MPRFAKRTLAALSLLFFAACAAAVPVPAVPSAACYNVHVEGFSSASKGDVIAGVVAWRQAGLDIRTQSDPGDCIPLTVSYPSPEEVTDIGPPPSAIGWAEPEYMHAYVFTDRIYLSSVRECLYTGPGAPGFWTDGVDECIATDYRATTRGVAIHEIGHLLGLKHTPTWMTVHSYMYPSADRWPTGPIPEFDAETVR